jgi:large subunit ribosomal protein L17
MRHRNNVKQLGRLQSHRKAMFSNMITSLFTHERIITTKQKGRELIRFSDKMISKAKNCIDLPEKDSKKLHNMRMVMRTIKKREVMSKLFNDIAPRYKDRKGGYTRLYLLGRRPGDAAEMALVELVERRVVEAKIETDKSKVKEAKEKKEKIEKADTGKKEKKEKKVTDKKEKKSSDKAKSKKENK